MKRSRINRVMQILTTLQAGQGCTVRDLSRMFGTSRRTIFRDLKELQAMGIPYHYDPGTGRYRMEPEYFLPPADLNLQEALALLLLAQKVSNQIQLPFRKSARLAALKIESNLPSELKSIAATFWSISGHEERTRHFSGRAVGLIGFSQNCRRRSRRNESSA